MIFRIFAKFLFLTEGMVKRTIALDNIASVKPEGISTRVVLKEIKDGSNISFLANEQYSSIESTIYRLANS
jgi:hypothetical protein